MTNFNITEMNLKSNMDRFIVNLPVSFAAIEDI